MSDINKAYQWVIDKCNASNVGYSQAYRNGQVVNGVEYYDCSSLLYFGLIAGGFDLDPTVNAFTTYTMTATLLNIGFIEVNVNDTWLAGDILLRDGHTEMVYTGRRTMGAHTDSYALADQVSINTYDSSTSSWEQCFRYGNGATGGGSSPKNWIYGNRYLSDSEMQNNAEIIHNYLIEKGWTKNAIAGLLGNMQQESTINPALWQSLNPNPAMGYGLVQWTPSTNYTNWANNNGYSITDGYYQLKWIDELSESSGQWIPTDDYPLSWSDFKSSTKSVTYLCSAFLKNFERAGIEVESKRHEYALRWFTFINGLINNGSSNLIYKRKKFNFMLFNRKRRFGI